MESNEKPWAAYLANHVFGIIDDPVRAKRAEHALANAGFPPDRVRVYCCGEEVARREVDPTGEAHGLMGRIKRAIQSVFGDELEEIKKFADEVAKGHPGFGVEFLTDDERERAHEILKSHGGRMMWYTTRWTYSPLG